MMTGVILTQSSTLAQESEDLCGTEVSTNLELSSDLVCDGDGLDVTAINLTINLNGHNIRGPGTDSNTTGISVDGLREVRIRGPGLVTGFGTGIAYTDSSGGSIRDTYLLRNDIGVLLDQVIDTHVKQDNFDSNRIGVLNRGSDNSEIEHVIMSRNEEGIRLENSRSVDVDFNIIMDGGTGVYMDKDSIGNELFYMTMFRNQGPDVTLANPGEGSNKNLFGNNECTRSTPTEICEVKAADSVMQNQTQSAAGNNSTDGLLAFQQPRATLAQKASGGEDLCGKTITKSIDLTADLTCSEDGLKVQGSNIIIKLNGFAMRGPGVDTDTTGIFVNGGHEVRIEGPGMIEFFGTGIKYSDAVGGTISYVQVGNSGVGLLADSSEKTQWKQLYVHDNRVGAIDDGSRNSDFESLSMSSNDVAVHVMGNSIGTDIDFSLILDGTTGIQVDPGVMSAKLFYNTMFRQVDLDMKLPTPLEGSLLGHNNCTASDPTQYCEGRVLPTGQRLTTNECGAGRAVEHTCVEGLNLPSGGSGEPEERGIGVQEHLTPEAQQAADAALQRIMNGTPQNQTQSEH
jgi:hypothetical protein